MLHFQDSHDDSPDPLTNIALNDLRSTGMREFVQNFTMAANLSADHPAPETDANTLPLDRWISERFTDLGHSPAIISRRPKLQYFARVTVCKPQWPELSHPRSYQLGNRRLSTTIEGVKRYIRHLEAEDLPFAQFAAAIDTRFWDARAEQAKLRFLEPISRANRGRRPLTVWTQRTALLLRDYIRRADEAGAQFQTSVLETRCLLWIYWEVLRVEGEILLSCSRLLDRWSLPEWRGRQQTPLLVKLFTLPHMLLLVPWRLTFDLAGDIADLFSNERPLYIPSAIQQFVLRPGAIALDFYLDGDLSHFFKTHRDLTDDVDRRLTAACQHWMNDVVRSEGLTLEADQVVEQIETMINEGYV